MQKIKDAYNWYVNTPWHRWWVEKVWKPSWTKLWNLILGLPAFTIVAGDYILSLAGDTKVSSFLMKMHVPDGVFIGIALISLIGYIASGRE